MAEQSETTPSNEKKTPMSDEERLALCQKLDKELDEFIDGLEKKRYTEGWPEDRWEEEMDKHPFFMKQAPQGDELSPLAEGLAKLKYDPDENTPLELATSYKEDGNFNFKHKNYRLALLGYTEGIKVRCGDAEMEASLYNNRAAAHWHLKNYRSCLADSEKALTFNPQHSKAKLRAAKAALEIGKCATTVSHCQKILESNPKDKEAKELILAARNKQQIRERDARKKDKLDKCSNEQKQAIVNAILERGIRISNFKDKDDINLSLLQPSLPGASDSAVYLEDGILKWPVLFLYPEYQMSDLIKDCPENVLLINQLQALFPAPWDTEDKYTCNTVNVYYEGYDSMPHIVSPNKNLSEVLVSKFFELKAGTPEFYILPRNSKIEEHFLDSFL